MVSKHIEITWPPKPENEDFPAAESYLYATSAGFGG